MLPPRSLNFVFLTHILALGGSNNTSCQVGGVFVAYRQPSVVGGLLISGLLVIPCISAGTLVISVGSKVILSNFFWFPDDNRQMVADNCKTVWTIVVVEVLVRQIRFHLGIHYLMYFLGRLNVIESSTCALCVSE